MNRPPSWPPRCWPGRCWRPAAAPRPGPAAAPASPAAPPSLATSLVTADRDVGCRGDGRFGRQHNNFWQLFVRPAGTSSWRLATPPGVASNGGLVLAGLPARVGAGRVPAQPGPVLLPARHHQRRRQSLVTRPARRRAGRRPRRPGRCPGQRAPARPAHRRHQPRSQALAAQAGPRWPPAGRSPPPRPEPGAGWSASPRPRSARPGIPCWRAGCGRPGIAGHLRPHRPDVAAHRAPLPAAYAHQAVTVLRLTTTGRTTTALLAAGTGPAERLLAAWSADGGTHWALSPPLPLNGATLTSVSSGPASSLAITLTHRRAAVITGSTDSWQQFPVLPPGTATLAPGPSGGWNALAVHGTQLTIWQAAPGAQAWARTQVIKVPVQFGSSG